MTPTGWSPRPYRKRTDPALVALLAAIAIIVISVSAWYVIRARGDRPHPARVETSQSACPTPPPGYSPCDPIPTNTGFQTGDKG